MPIVFDEPSTKPSIVFDEPNQPAQPQSDGPSIQFDEPTQNEGDLGTAVVGTALEVTGGLSGAMGGGALGLAVAGPPGAAVGAALGGFGLGAFGNYLKQKLEIYTGERKEVKGGEVVSSGILSAIPGGLGAKAISEAATIAKPALIRAAQGGSAAAAAKLAEITIDEGRLPTLEEVGTKVLPAAAVGGALGGAMGAVEKRYQMVGGLITNPAVAQGVQVAAGIGAAGVAYNNAVEKGEDNPLTQAVLYGVGVYGLTKVPGMIAKADKKNVARMALGPEAVLPVGAVEAVRGYENQQSAVQRQAASLANSINETISKSKDPAGLTRDFLAVMDGNASPTSMPKDLLTYLGEFNRLRAENASLIIQRYPDLDEGLKDTILKNSRSYIRTAYAAHDPNAVSGVDYATPEATKAFKKSLMDRGLDEQTAETVMARMRGDVAYVYSGGRDPKGTSPTSAFMRKGDLSDEAKAFLGEVQDPGRRAQQTLNTQSRLILQDKRDEQILNVLKASGLASDSTAKVVDPSHTTLLIEAKDPVFHGKMANVLVPDYVAKAYKELMSPHLFGEGTAARTLMGVAGFSKATKTVGNLPEAIAPQMAANVALAASSLKANPKDLQEGFRKMAYVNGWRGGNMSAAERVAFDREVREAMSLGILKGGADVQELKAYMDASLKESNFKGVMDKMSKAYGYPDSAVRYAIWKGNIEELKSFKLGLGMDEIKARAAKITNSQFPTYENIPRRFRQASAATIANVFGAFEFEVVRNSMNQIRYASQLIKEGNATGNKAMQVAGAKRLLAFATVAGTTAGVATYGSRLLGTSQQEEEDLSKVLPPYDANKANIINMGDGNGKFSYAPVNYLFPHANSIAAIAAGVKGENPLPYIKTTLLGDDLGPLATSGIEAITNTYYGTKVPITEPRDNVALTERFVTRAFMPNFVVGTLTRAEKAVKGETNKLGASPTMGDVGLRLGGYRQNTLDILGSATTRIRDINDPLTGELTGYRQILKKAQIQPGGLERINEGAVYQERAQRYLEGQKRLQDIFQSLKRLSDRGGFKDDDIIAAFRQAGVPSRLIAGAAMGYFVPMPRGLAETNSDIVHEVMSSEEAKANPKVIPSMLAARAGGDPEKAKQLASAFKEAAITKARGGDAYTKLFGGLGVSDGERAQNVYASIKSTREKAGEAAADALMKKLVANKVVTPEVMKQLNQLASKDAAEGR